MLYKERLPVPLWLCPYRWQAVWKVSRLFPTFNLSSVSDIAMRAIRVISLWWFSSSRTEESLLWLLHQISVTGRGCTKFSRVTKGKLSADSLLPGDPALECILLQQALLSSLWVPPPFWLCSLPHFFFFNPLSLCLLFKGNVIITEVIISFQVELTINLGS